MTPRSGLDCLPIAVRNVALGAGLAVALSGPFVMAAAVPDSTLPFAVLATAACLVLPAATQGRSRAVVALGVLAGLAYLTRMEAIFLGGVFLFVGWRMQIGWGSLFRRGVAVALIAAAVAVPWWLRNVAVFGTPLPGQIADNLLLTNNAQIFAFSQRPTLDAFLAQGLPGHPRQHRCRAVAQRGRCPAGARGGLQRRRLSWLHWPSSPAAAGAGRVRPPRWEL